jgi:hypothetical protein
VLVAFAEIEELARGVAIAVEVHLERRLLGPRQRAGDVASAVQQIVETGRQLGVIDDLRGDLNSNITRVRQRRPVYADDTAGRKPTPTRYSLARTPGADRP